MRCAVVKAKSMGLIKSFFEMLGFVLEGKTSQSVPAHEKSLVHCCCESGSLLSNPSGGTSTKVVDVMKEKDFTN